MSAWFPQLYETPPTSFYPSRTVSVLHGVGVGWGVGGQRGAGRTVARALTGHQKYRIPLTALWTPSGNSPLRVPCQWIAPAGSQVLPILNSIPSSPCPPPHYLPLAGTLCTPEGGKCEPLQTPSEQDWEKPLKLEPSAAPHQRKQTGGCQCPA